MAEELLTIREAAGVLQGKVAQSTLYQAVETKSLPHYRVSGGGRRGKILVTRADLLAWLERQKVTPGASAPASEDDWP